MATEQQFTAATARMMRRHIADGRTADRCGWPRNSLGLAVRRLADDLERALAELEARTPPTAKGTPA